MLRRILAIGFIFLCTTVAWGVLSATIFSRTEGSGSGLREKVAGSWGSEQEATPPIAEYYRTETHKVTKKLDDKDIQELVQEKVPYGLPLESNHLTAVDRPRLPAKRADVVFHLQSRIRGRLRVPQHQRSGGDRNVPAASARNAFHL